jgi:hypothetical protein
MARLEPSTVAATIHRPRAPLSRMRESGPAGRPLLPVLWVPVLWLPVLWVPVPWLRPAPGPLLACPLTHATVPCRAAVINSESRHDR